MWPDDRELPVEVEAAFGADLTVNSGAWAWTDLSSRLRAESIRLRAGRSSGAGMVSPSTCVVTLDNPDSALTPGHPMSPYWPNVQLGTPLRVRIRRGEDAFARTVSSGWGTADSGQVWTTGGTAAADFSVAAGVARHTHSTVNNIRRTYLATSLTDVEQVIDVAPSALLTGAALVTGFLFRFDPATTTYYWLRCEFNSGGTSIMLKLSKCVAGTFTDLAVLNPVPGLAYAANTYLRIRASVVGSKLAMKVWNPAGAEPAGWQVTATDTAITAAGANGLQSWLVAGNTNTLPVTALHKSYTLRVDRFNGYADQWEPSFVPTGTPGQADSVVNVTASGLLRRLGQGTPPVRSPLRRTYSASGAVAYWPLEDGVSATQAASAFTDHPPAAVTGSAQFVDVADFSWADQDPLTLRFGTGKVLDLKAGGRVRATMPGSVTTATTTAWTVAVAALADALQHSTDLVLLEVATAGTFAKWRLVQHPGVYGYDVIAYDLSGTPTTVTSTNVGDLTFTPHWLSVWQDGATIRVSRDGLDLGSIAGTLGGVKSIDLNPTGTTYSGESMPFGHLALWAAAQLPDNARPSWIVSGQLFYGAFYSWWQETATARLARLGAEDGVPIDIPPVSAAGETRMGWQPDGAPLDLYQECVDADLGVLYEIGFGLGYIPREYRYNRPVGLAIDLATYAVTRGSQGDVLRPVLDDQGIVNQLTVTRTDGSSVVAANPVSQRRNGVYAGTVDLNLATDGQLPDQASWRLSLDNVDRMREQTFPVDLAANPELLDGWLSCGVGSRILGTNPPAQYGADPLDRLVEGWSETIGPRSWLVQVNPSPAAPWDVGVVDVSRVGADGSTLNSAIPNGTWGSFEIKSTAWNGPWPTVAAEFPMLVQVGGEVMRVSTIGGTGLVQTAIVSQRGVNGVARDWPAGTPVDVYQPAVVAL